MRHCEAFGKRLLSCQQSIFVLRKDITNFLQLHGGTHPLKGHAVEDHARACGDVLHREHVHAHPKPVQQLRPELPLLHQDCPMSDALAAVMRPALVLRCLPGVRFSAK